MSSKTNSQILSFTRPRSATPPHGSGLHPCTHAGGIEQAFATKCWFFEATIVDLHSLPSIPGSLRTIRAIPAFTLIAIAAKILAEIFFAKGAR
jgi:hypothetical protein